MKLLVSVATPDEAEIALLAGADIIDAKDPSAGALGAVRPDVLAEIHRVTRRRRLLSAALGDATDAAIVERLAEEYVARGAQLVKVGFAGIESELCVADLLAAAVRGSATADPSAGVVSVAYADGDAAGSIDPTRLIEIASRAGATGVLVDTANKRGPGLTGLWSATELTTWVARVHDRGLVAAVAGKLEARDLTIVEAAGADVAGIRGAACSGGRNGRVSRDLVQRLVALTQIAETSHSALRG